MMTVRKSKRGIEKIVRSVMDQSMKSLLHDIDYRISILADLAAGANRVHSAELSMNIPWHLLDGFTFDANKPTAGNIKWTGCHIVYKGIDYTIADGNTDKKYVCWLLSSPTAFTCGDVKPELTIDDVIVAINDNGTPRIQIVPGKMVHGSSILSGSVDSGELANGAVISDKIGALAVIEGKIASNAVTSNKIQDNAVTTSKIGDNQVTGPKIGAGAIGETKLNVAMHLMW
jgi:hypothetical protein